jgi:hypothetical protein
VEAARKAAEEREAVRRAAEEQAWRQLELAEEAAWSIVAAQQGVEGGQPTPGAGQVPDAEATLHAAACRRATEVVARRVAAGELSTHAAVQAALEEATHEAYSELVQQQQQPQGRRGSGTPEPGGERYNAYRRREDIEEDEVARARAHAAALARQEAQAQAQRQREEQQEQAQLAEAADHAAAVDAAAAAAAWEESVAESQREVHEEQQAAEAPPPGVETAMPMPRVVQVVAAVQHEPHVASGPGDGGAAPEEEDEEERRHREWAAAEEARVAALWAEHDEMESRTAVTRQRRDEEESQRQALLRILAGEDDAEAAAAAAQVLQLPSPPRSPQVLQPGARSQRRDVFGRDGGGEEGKLEEAAPAAELPTPAQPAPAPPAPPAPPVVSVDELVAAAQLAARQSAAAARKAAASMDDPSSTEAVNSAYALACTAEHTARELLAGLQLPLPEDCASAPSSSPVVGAAAASVALLACATGCECAAVQLGMLGPRHRGSGAAGLVSAALAMQAACSDAAHQEEYMAVLQQARLRKAVETEARVVAEAAGEVASRTAKHAMARQQQQQQEQQARLRAEALRAHEARERARHAASMRHAAARHVGAGFDARLVDLAAAWAPPAPAPPPVEVPMDEESALARARARVEALMAAEARGVEYEEEAEPAAAHTPPPQQQQQDQPPSPPASSVDAPFDWPASPTASAAVLRPMGVRRSTGKGSRGSRSPPPAVVPVEPAWQGAPSHAGSGMDLQAAENRLKALEAAMEAHRLLAADHAIQALPLRARLQVEQTVAGITAAAGNVGEDVAVADLRRLMPPQAAGVPVPRSMSATMAAANSVGESALQTLAAVRASRRQLTSLP